MPTLKELRATASRKRKDFLYRLVDRLAYYPAIPLLWLGLTPNQVTVIWILGQLVSAYFLTTGHYLTMVIALVVFQLMFVLDCTDGIMARYTKNFSINGEYLDYIGHYLANPLLLGCLAVGVYRIHHNPIYLIAGGVAVVSFLLNKALTINSFWYKNPVHRHGIENVYSSSLLQNQTGLLHFAFAFMRLEYLFNFMFWGILFGYAHYTLLIYAVLFFIELCRLLITQYIRNEKLNTRLTTQKKDRDAVSSSHNS